MSNRRKYKALRNHEKGTKKADWRGKSGERRCWGNLGKASQRRPGLS